MLKKKAAALIGKIKAAHRKPEPAPSRPEYIFIHDDQENLLKLIDHIIDLLNADACSRSALLTELVTLRSILSQVNRDSVRVVISSICDKKEGSADA